MHLYLLNSDRVLFLAVVHRSEFLSEVLLYLLNLAADQDFVLEVLSDIDTNLLTD